MKKLLVVLCCVVLLGGNSVALASQLTFEELMAKVEEQFVTLEDIRARIVIEVVEGERTNRSVAMIDASQTHKIARVELLEPEIMAGQIFVADQANNVVKMYSPIIEQIMVQSTDSMADSAGLGIDFTDLTNVFS